MSVLKPNAKKKLLNNKGKSSVQEDEKQTDISCFILFYFIYI